MVTIVLQSHWIFLVSSVRNHSFFLVLSHDPRKNSIPDPSKQRTVVFATFHFSDTLEYTSVSMGRPQLLRFWVYIVPLIPSILCSIFVLYHLLTQRALRTAANNHALILMLSFGLLYEVTDIIWYIHFYLTGTPLSATPIFCRIWVFNDGCLYIIITMLMAWASIERHILIFHQNWIATKIKRFFIHYLPLIVCSAYPTLFYGAIFFFIPCDVPFDYASGACGYYSCISLNQSLSLWDSLVNFLLPGCVIVIFSVALFVRVLYQRCRIHRRIEWRNHRKMTVQLLSISAVYFIFLLPPMVYNTVYSIGLPWDGGSDYFWATIYLGYFTVLLTPFVCVLSLPELRSKCKKIFFFRQRRAIGPTSVVSIRKNHTPAATLTITKQ